jgi:hypothetical protein
MTTRIVTDANGRKHTTNEPLLHPPKRNVACPCGTATPREWVGLTDDEIELLRDMIDWSVGWSYIEFARAAEAKLREKNSL